MDTGQTKSLVRRYFEALINRRDLSICDELLAPNYVDHDAPEDTPPGPESIKAYVAGFLDDHPDMRITIEEMIAEGNQVAARLIWRGTNRHSGAPFRQMGLIMLRLDEQGRFVERWSAYVPLA
ncbi:MAG TPA: ester cyclase [Anaerolineae bacterium]|nr:ester cyclase [Anaerolineae bacterium]